MKALSLLLLLISLILFAFGCTDATWDKYAVLGNKAEVKCYSGPLLIFHGLSTGKISNETNSDGYFARWNVIKVDGQWKHIDTSKPLSAGVSGNCTIIYID
tara:strand:- start:2166 stop:2468 length:303 start_codon:yes stop_codon:yes gene_type:complete